MNDDLLKLNYSTSINVEGMNEEVANITLDDAVISTATITGKVTTDGTIPVEGAVVKVFDSTGTPYMHTITDQNGNYMLESLAPGSYTVAVTKNGYKLTDAQGVTLTAGQSIALSFQLTTDLSVSIGVISGTLKDDDGNRVSNATITVYDGSSAIVATTLTADDGEFVLYELANGTYTVVASKHGYVTSAAHIATISDTSKIANLSISVSKNSTFYKGTINGLITDKHGLAVPNAFVGLYSIILDDEDDKKIKSETLTAVTKTNSSGKYLFGNVSEGNYLIKSKKNQD